MDQKRFLKAFFFYRDTNTIMRETLIDLHKSQKNCKRFGNLGLKCAVCTAKLLS